MSETVIKTGTIITIDGHELTVIDITTTETVDGRSAVIHAVDEESARKMQLRMMQQEHIGEDALDGVKKLIAMFTSGKFPGMPDFPAGG